MDKYSITAKSIGPTMFCAEARGHRVYCDVPAEIGGQDNAMLPPELMLSATAGCLGGVIVLLCKRKRLPYEGVEVTIEADNVDEGKRVDNLVVKIRLPGIDREVAEKIVNHSVAWCKVGNTIKQETNMLVEIEEAE